MIRKILIRLNQFLLILSTTILLLAIIISVTILNKKYILSILERNDYYNKVYYDSLSTIEGYTIQVGLTGEEVEKILTKEKVTNDIKNLINYIYDNQELKLDTKSLSNNIEELIQNKLRENNRSATQEELIGITNLKKQITDSYEDKILYSKKYILKIRDTYHKLSKYQKKILFLLSCIEFFLIASLQLVSKSFKVFLKTLGSTLLSTFFITLSTKIFIQPKLQHIVIFSSILSKLAITITNDIFKILFVTSSILGIFGLLLIIIGVVKINKKV